VFLLKHFFAIDKGVVRLLRCLDLLFTSVLFNLCEQGLVLLWLKAVRLEELDSDKCFLHVHFKLIESLIDLIFPLWVNYFDF
jgi:hypothetical protein